MFRRAVNRGRCRRFRPLVTLVLGMLLHCCAATPGVAATPEARSAFPPPLESYQDSHLTSVSQVLRHRIQVHRYNLWATLLFLGAVTHTFCTHKFRHWAHVVEKKHRAKANGLPVSPSARVLHFFGEVEAVFGLWIIPLLVVLSLQVGWKPVVAYVNHGVSYAEPIFVVVIMSIAATKPILQLAESCLSGLARVGRKSVAAWWLAILTAGPLLGSFITEPGAMTIAAMLLARQFYVLKPPPRLAYATLGLLFVNVSVGGTLTHFAAPPVLMVSATWQWSTPFMLKTFGLASIAGICISNVIYFFIFRRDLAKLTAKPPLKSSAGAESKANRRIPAWVTLIHVAWMAWSVYNAHNLAFLMGGFLMFLAFYHATEDWQGPLELRGPILVGFFLAGLVVHGGLQQWWIEPVITSLNDVALLLGATVLTGFNDNAAITYLASRVPDLAMTTKYAVVAGAVAGGGLTVIANAPNPAGQSILAIFFPNGVSPLKLFLAALAPTVVMVVCFLVGLACVS